MKSRKQQKRTKPYPIKIPGAKIHVNPTVLNNKNLLLAILNTISELYTIDGDDFFTSCVCTESSKTFSTHLKKLEIPHDRIIGGEHSEIDWHCWVRIPRYGIFDFCQGQIWEKSKYHDILLGAKDKPLVKHYLSDTGRVIRYRKDL